MNTNDFDYDAFFGGSESGEILSNNTTSPSLTEFDSDSGIANTPPMPLGLDDAVINFDTLDILPMNIENFLSNDPTGEFDEFSTLFNQKDLPINENNSTFDDLFSTRICETSQQIPPTPLCEMPPIINCVKVPSFANAATTGAKCIKIDTINSNKNIKILKTTQPITFTNGSVVTFPLKATVKPIETIESSPIKRRRANSPTTENKTLTIEDLRLQYGNINEDVLKKHLRMIKNRESASLSRKRRKELMENLDTKVKRLTDENEELKKENSKLLTRINTLEIENELLKKYQFKNDQTSSTRKSVVLMGVVLLFAFNVFFIRSFVPNRNNLTGSIALYNENHNAVVPSRTILSHNDQNSYSNANDNDYGSDRIDNNNSPVIPTYPYIQCVAYINKTHSQRINQDLRSWVQDQSEKQQETNSNIISDSTSLTISPNSIIQKPIDPSVQPPHHFSRKVARHAKIQSENKGQLQRFDTNYDDFIRTIDRKNDTLYFISFKRDHLILPATIQNQTERPKLSLILPASMANLNKSIQIPINHVPMIKIDCEVEDTKLVFVKRTHVPSSYRNDLFQYYSSVPQASI